MGRTAVRSRPGLQAEEKGYCLQNAQPVNFPDCVEKATGSAVEMPAHLRSLMAKPKDAMTIDPVYEVFRDVLPDLP